MSIHDAKLRRRLTSGEDVESVAKWFIERMAEKAKNPREGDTNADTRREHAAAGGCQPVQRHYLRGAFQNRREWPQFSTTIPPENSSPIGDKIGRHTLRCACLTPKAASNDGKTV
jgi:hypothetical protein